ncbi:MAG: HesA/MoeB/ThiF family protein [Firmicutes bacterium]|nr:HesA/MoeB/ThiF family protein [Bacillota bacterium]
MVFRREWGEVGLVEGIRDKSREVALAKGRLKILPVAAELTLAQEWKSTLWEVQLSALGNDILPARYLRNYGTVGMAGQKNLLQSCVAIIGAGGLGGWIIELLARMGVGRLVVVDGDSFEDSNLNRQNLATLGNLGTAKAVAARRRAAEINGAVTVKGHATWLTEDNAREILKPAQVVVDALDNVPTRFILQDAARELGIPLIHGAIAGYQGQVTTIFPGDAGFKILYPGAGEGPTRGTEVALGTPAATPPMVASWQVQETVKIILGQGETLRHRLLYLDALSGTAEVLHLPG